MRVLTICFVLGAVGLDFGVQSAPAQSEKPNIAADQVIRTAVSRSLPFLEEHGESWVEERKCVSCHRVAMMTWSFSTAQRRGFDVDQEKLTQWINWSIEASLKKREQDDELVGSKNLDGLAQLILGRNREADDKESSESYAAFIDLMTAGQDSDGFWPAAGQLPSQKRPKAETNEVTTMWITAALFSAGDLQADALAARDTAMNWLDQTTEAKSTEWFVARLVLEHFSGRRERETEAIGELRSLQCDDGGWPWLVGGKSDALATGQSLYALHLAGVPRNDPTIVRAVTYLIESQRSDGSWAVYGTKANKKVRIEETAVYWGTAWATIGLLQSLPVTDVSQDRATAGNPHSAQSDGVRLELND